LTSLHASPSGTDGQIARAWLAPEATANELDSLTQGCGLGSRIGIGRFPYRRSGLSTNRWSENPGPGYNSNNNMALPVLFILPKPLSAGTLQSTQPNKGIVAQLRVRLADSVGQPWVEP
jgi:hypothetical protein